MVRCIPSFRDDPADASLAAHLEAAKFTGELAQLAFAPSPDEPTLLVGLGSRDELTASRLRIAFAAAGRALGHLEQVEVDVTPVDAAVLAAEARDQAAAEGLLLGGYQFRKYRAGGTPPTTRWTPLAPSSAWDRGVAIASAVAKVRDLVNEPANKLTPSILAGELVSIAASSGLIANVRDEEWLVEQGAGGILAIGQGSAERPMLVELVHEGAGGAVDLCLTGKGVTFDSGGLSLKSADQLITMNLDMAGAATVALAMTLLADIAPALNVRAYIPLVENMPGPYAVRPGDVVTARNGKTIEVLNTDFEGRTILADALSFASEQDPALIVDVATLTYGATVALGPRMGAVLGSDDGVPHVEAAAASSGEPMWRLPIQDWMQPTIASRVADVKNFPFQPSARAITAAMFLREFITPGLPWAHLDIAGPAWAYEQQELSGEGATGFGLRLLVDLFEDLAALR